MFNNNIWYVCRVTSRYKYFYIGKSMAIFFSSDYNKFNKIMEVTEISSIFALCLERKLFSSLDAL